jgi:predicted transcriptional regulator
MSARLGITRRLWLFLLEHGGHWTTAELAEQLGASNTYIDRILWSMHDCGSVSKYRSGQRKNGVAFGVTPRNRIPHGLTLADVTAATQVRSVMDADERKAA